MLITLTHIPDVIDLVRHGFDWDLHLQTGGTRPVCFRGVGDVVEYFTTWEEWRPACQVLDSRIKLTRDDAVLVLRKYQVELYRQKCVILADVSHKALSAVLCAPVEGVPNAWTVRRMGTESGPGFEACVIKMAPVLAGESWIEVMV